MYWTQWFNADMDDTDMRDFETITRHRAVYVRFSAKTIRMQLFNVALFIQGDAVCNGDGDDYVVRAQCRVVGTTDLWMTGVSVLEEGFECTAMGLWCEDHNNTNSGPCADYEVRYQCSGTYGNSNLPLYI